MEKRGSRKIKIMMTKKVKRTFEYLQKCLLGKNATCIYEVSFKKSPQETLARDQ